MKAVVEGFQKNGTLGITTTTTTIELGLINKKRGAEKFLGFLGIGNRWLLQENVLACLEGLQGPFTVQTVWERDVYAVNIGVVEERLVICLDVRDAVFSGIGGRFGMVARSDSLDDDVGMRLGWENESKWAALD